MSALKHLRQKTYEFLDGNNRSTVNRIFNLFIILLILTNVVAVVFESYKPIGNNYSLEFYLLEIFSVLVFTVEFIGRVWTSVEKIKYKDDSSFKARLKYLFTPMAIIDLLAIAPFYLALFFSIDLRYLRLMRVLRLLKLSHYFKGLDIFLTVIMKEIITFATIILTVVILVILSASLMYTLESEAQPEVFTSIPHSIWWAVVTMTTVGYGDVTPITLGGRILAGTIMLLGVGIVALPAGMLAARFGEELQIRKDRMKTQVLHALRDGVVNEQEQADLENFAHDLGLSMDALRDLIDMQKAQHHLLSECPHCGKPINSDIKLHLDKH